MDAKAFNDVLTKFVKPYNFPLAVRMTQKGEAIPDRTKKPMHDLKHPITICQAIAIARQIGWSV